MVAVFFDETGLRHAGDETGLRHAGDETGPAPHGNAGEKRLAVPHEDVAQVVAGNAGELVDGRDGRGPVVGHVPPREEARDVEGNLRVE